MGFDYALVHAKYTIPPALLLTFLYRPLFTKLDIYKTFFLITIAVVSTIPWDSYLIRHRVWTYPPNAVLGPVIFQIPIEELFFFVIQTYDVSLLYLCITKSTFHPRYLPCQHDSQNKTGSLVDAHGLIGSLGNVIFAVAIPFSIQLVRNGGVGTYMGLIIAWAAPFLLLLWSLSNKFLLRLPRGDVLIPIILPTIYLWLVDTFALRRGTWVIEKGTKLGIYLWPGLEIEEAFFFLVTDTLIVFGLIAFDNAVAILDSFPHLFPRPPSLPSPVLAVKALMVPQAKYNAERIEAFSQSIGTLQKKSRSFYLASSTFRGRLRIDLILLYAFCRIADDLVDSASAVEEATYWIHRLREFLDIAYASADNTEPKSKLRSYVRATFPERFHLQLFYLPTSVLTDDSLYALLKGFEIDLQFSESKIIRGSDDWPIQDDSDLEKYGYFVAGTVAELCLDLVFHHTMNSFTLKEKSMLKLAGVNMGIALQTVNIARDIKVDAEMGRVYIPSEWLREQELEPELVVENPSRSETATLRTSLLDKAFDFYSKARPAIEKLPSEVRGPMRVAVESYMEIGRVLRQESYIVKQGKATVPRQRRIWVAWRELNK